MFYVISGICLKEDNIQQGLVYMPTDMMVIKVKLEIIVDPSAMPEEVSSKAQKCPETTLYQIIVRIWINQWSAMLFTSVTNYILKYWTYASSG